MSAQVSNVVYVGVDIAKLSLAIALPDQAWSLNNTAKEHAEFIARLRRLSAPAQVICEASGGYERALVSALHVAQIAVTVVNPRKARDFARANGGLAKTDKIDARQLACYGASLRPVADLVPGPGQEVLAELVRTRQDLVELLSAEGSRREHTTLPALQKLAQARERQLTQQLQRLEAMIDAHIQADPELAPKAQRLHAVQGIGPVSVCTVLALLPELGTVTDNQAAALAGVAPFNNDSGNFRGQRHVRGGRPAVRRVLYMAAVSARHHNPILKAFYRSLIARGKLPKVALTAVMRKLIVLLNRLLKNPHFVLAR
jgi:transposase